MKDRIILAAAFLMVGAGAIYTMNIYGKYRKGQTEYANLQRDYTSRQTEKEETEGDTAWDLREGVSLDDGALLPEDAPERICVDFDSLCAVNGDVVGWIELPAAELSYPVLQGDDNEYYLHRDINREPLFAGSIFMDYYNSPSLQNYNTIIYGHNMRDQTMFARLREYQDTETYTSCPYFWIYTPGKDCLYRIFSVHTAPAQGETYTVRFADREAYAAWIEKMKEISVIETEDGPQPGDCVVTLSTCTGDEAKRQVVQGVLIWTGRSTP